MAKLAVGAFDTETHQVVGTGLASYVLVNALATMPAEARLVPGALQGALGWSDVEIQALWVVTLTGISPKLTHGHLLEIVLVQEVALPTAPRVLLTQSTQPAWEAESIFHHEKCQAPNIRIAAWKRTSVCRLQLPCWHSYYADTDTPSLFDICLGHSTDRFASPANSHPAGSLQKRVAVSDGATVAAGWCGRRSSQHLWHACGCTCYGEGR